MKWKINSRDSVIAIVRLRKTERPLNGVIQMEQSHPSTTDSDSSPEDTKFVVSEQEGLQLHRGRNLFQLAALLILAAIGAIVGWFLSEDRPDLAALVGGVLGMIVGTFLSGFLLMFLPPAATTMTLAKFQRKYRGTKRRLIISSIAFAVFLLTLPIIISRFGHDDSDLAWCMCLTWIASTAGLCFYTKILASRVRELKCPACGRLLGRVRSSCSHCGLSLTPGSKAAI